MSFGRIYKLSVGQPDTTGILISDLNIEFIILKSDDNKDSSSGSATIKVYNLSGDSINRIRQDDVIILQAGYLTDNQEPLIIYTGDILYVETYTMGTEVVTEITAKEGYVPRRQGVTSRTYEGEGKTSVERVMRDIISSDLNLPIAKIHNGELGDSKGLNKTFQGSTSYIGNSSEILNELANQNDLTWFVRDGKVYVYPINSSTNIVQTRVISLNSGLLSSPKSLITKAERLKDTKDLKKGFKLKVILDGTYNIGDLVSINSLYTETEGVYRISKIKTSGQYEGEDWTMELDVLEVI